MKYVAVDAVGKTFSIVSMINRDEEEIENIEEAVAMVIQLAEDQWLPVAAGECPFSIYTVH